MDSRGGAGLADPAHRCSAAGGGVAGVMWGQREGQAYGARLCLQLWRHTVDEVSVNCVQLCHGSARLTKKEPKLTFTELQNFTSVKS